MKTITLHTKITFTATGDKYAISEQTATGFQFKPIRFEKGLPTVPRTFQELKEEFLSGQIDISGFEHNEVDNCLVELIMNGYIHQAEIETLTAQLADVSSERTLLNDKVTEQTALLEQKDATISQHTETIAQSTIAMETNQHTHNELQSEFFKTKQELTDTKAESDSLKRQVIQLKNELQAEKEARQTDSDNWQKEKAQYEASIEALEETTTIK